MTLSGRIDSIHLNSPLRKDAQREFFESFNFVATPIHFATYGGVS
jgi:hypothetical protein